MRKGSFHAGEFGELTDKKLQPAPQGRPAVVNEVAARRFRSASATRPRSIHHEPRAAARWTALAWSCSRDQARACSTLLVSASSHRAAASSPVLVCSPAAARSAVFRAYRVSAAERL